MPTSTLFTDKIPVTGWLHTDKIWTLGDYGHKVMLKDYPELAVKFEPMVVQTAAIDLERAARDLLRAFDKPLGSDENHLGAEPALASAKRALGLNPRVRFNDAVDLGGLPVAGWLHEDKIFTLGNFSHQAMRKECPVSAAKYEPMVRQAALVEIERAILKMLQAFDPAERCGLRQNLDAMAALASAKQVLGLEFPVVVCRPGAVTH